MGNSMCDEYIDEITRLKKELADREAKVRVLKSVLLSLLDTLRLAINHEDSDALFTGLSECTDSLRFYGEE